MRRHRHLIVVALALIVITINGLAADRSIDVVGSPVVAVALASAATALTLRRSDPAVRAQAVIRRKGSRRGDLAWAGSEPALSPGWPASGS